MTKRVRIIADWYYPSSLATATRLGPLVEALRHLEGIEVSVATDQISSELTYVKPNFFSSPKNSMGFIRRLIQELFLGVELFTRIIFSSVDLFIISSPPFIAAAFCSWACRIRGIPYFFDVRDLYPDVYAKAGILKPKSWIYRELEKLEVACYRNARQVFSVTPKLCEQINEKSGKNHCVLLRNGFSEKNFKISKVKNKNFTVVFHGNLGRFQNPALLIEIARHFEKTHPEIQFIIIGDGPQEELVKQVNLSNFKYLGRLENALVAEVIAKCHLGVSFRSDDEISIFSFPVKVYEYIGVGIPIIVTPISEGGELVESMNLGSQFRNQDKELIISEINRLYRDTEYYAAIQENILKVRSQFSREIQATQFAEIVIRHLT